MGDFTERPAPGTRVHVEFDGIVDPDIIPERFWGVAVNDGDEYNGRLHYVNWQSDKVTLVSPPVPENWPPQPGDTWRLVIEPTQIYHVMRNSIGDGSHNGDGLLYFYTPFGGYKYKIANPDGWELAYRPEHIV